MLILYLRGGSWDQRVQSVPPFGIQLLAPSQLLLVEVAIHTILYVRQVYPVELFFRRKKYDAVVFQSRHPALNEYISGAVKAIEDELTLVRLILCFLCYWLIDKRRGLWTRSWLSSRIRRKLPLNVSYLPLTAWSL